MSEDYKGMAPEAAGHESGHPGANEKKTMKAMQSREVEVVASRPRAEILCNPEHQIADASPTPAVPLHSPSLTSSPSGDVASSEVSFISCWSLYQRSCVGIKFYSCLWWPTFHFSQFLTHIM
jgi:hypothetical protein